jgi:hypothetical protein
VVAGDDGAAGRPDPDAGRPGVPDRVVRDDGVANGRLDADRAGRLDHVARDRPPVGREVEAVSRGRKHRVADHGVARPRALEFDAVERVVGEGVAGDGQVRDVARDVDSRALLAEVALPADVADDGNVPHGLLDAEVDGPAVAAGRDVADDGVVARAGSPWGPL